MAERVLDVHLEFDPAALSLEHDPVQTVAEASRHEAESQCAQHLATLRHPDPREVISRHANDILTGRPVLLVSTRWIADGPA